MSAELPAVPEGSGKSPIVLVVLTANNLPASSQFYSTVFGWQLQPMTAELTAAMLPGPPSAALRGGQPAGFPSMVPFIGVSDVDLMLSRVVSLGGSIEKAPWKVPMVGKLARFRDPAGTIYGITEGLPATALARMPMPVGSNPRPPAGSICHIEMYAADRPGSAAFLGELFGWGSIETMPNYTAFDAGVGIGGILQSHTPSLPAVAYIYVEDAAAKLNQIEQSGGRKLAEAMSIPGMATFGYFEDPSGARMGLIGP